MEQPRDTAKSLTAMGKSFAKGAIETAKQKTNDMVDTVQGKVNQVTDYATKQAISQLISVVETAAREYEEKSINKYPATLTASVSVATLVNLELQITIPGSANHEPADQVIAEKP